MRSGPLATSQKHCTNELNSKWLTKPRLVILQLSLAPYSTILPPEGSLSCDTLPLDHLLTRHPAIPEKHAAIDYSYAKSAIGCLAQGPGLQRQQAWRTLSGREKCSGIMCSYVCLGARTVEHRNGLSQIIRSHQVHSAGYAVNHNGMTTTVFTASNYAGTDNNFGCYLVCHSDAISAFHERNMSP